MERSEKVAAFIEDIDKTPITWAAVVSSEKYSHERRAAATSMSVKKAITSTLDRAIFGGNTDSEVLLHDGNYDEYGQYEHNFRKQIAADFDTSFQANICSVHPVFLQHADRTYPQTNAADYVASYLRNQLISGNSIDDLKYDNINELDPSWVRQAGQPAPLYELETLRPIVESSVRSRVLCWLLGKGIPPSPDPTTHDLLEELVNQIKDDIVREYLLCEV
jgi:hypothetical protein